MAVRLPKCIHHIIDYVRVAGGSVIDYMAISATNAMMHKPAYMTHDLPAKGKCQSIS